MATDDPTLSPEDAKGVVSWFTRNPVAANLLMLVLLIVFMVTAPMLNQGIEVDLPQANNEPLEIDENYALESALYIANEQKVSDLLTVNYGVRYSNFMQRGPGDVFTFDEEGEVTDTTTYSKWENVKTYHGIAPRLSATYLLNEVSSIKASAGRTYQYLHLLSNSTTTLLPNNPLSTN